MATSHHVDLLSSGLVMKAATSEDFNEKLKSEINQIKALHTIYPDLMVPVLHDGLVAGRHFYILEKKSSLPLSNIVFDSLRPLDQRGMIIRTALDEIEKAIRAELSGQDTLCCDMHSRLVEEWHAVGFMHELFDKPILLDGVPCRLTGRQVVDKAIALSQTETFASVETAHFNFHFGNVLYSDKSTQVNFIDPDFSVRGIDPLFGFSRFAFSFWHELAAEVGDAVKIVPMPDAIMFVLLQSDHRNLLRDTPELRGISGLAPWVSESALQKFYVLTAYCFLRSIRINGSQDEWSAPRTPTIARPEEVLLLGLLAYLEAPNLA